MKKRITAMFLCAAVAVSAIGCSGSSGAGKASEVKEQVKTENESESGERPESEQKEKDAAGIQVSQEELVKEALGPDVWKDHLENDLMKFWTNPDAQDMSSGLFPTFLTNRGEKIPEQESEYPEEIQAAFADSDAKGLMDTDNDYIRAHSRLTYAYGVAYHMTGNPEYLKMCRKGTLALLEAFDGEFGMYVKKNKVTGEWDGNRDARTSQDLAYGITGMGMYYFLTHDESVLKGIIKAKDYIFNTYFDENKGYFTWLPKDTEDSQTQIVAQLDQLYAYMLMLTPCLPEPYQTQRKGDMKAIADILINRFYSEKNKLFWGVVNDSGKMSLGSGHTDFGHSVKTMWVILKTGQVIGEPFYVDFARPKIDNILKEAYLEENGSWASRFHADGTLDKRKEWWIVAELDQAAEILSVNDPSYYEYLNNTQRYWMDKMTDKENGEIWAVVDENGQPVLSYPKAHCWKTSLHSFEHALFGYMTAAQIKGEDFDLYYAFPENEEISEKTVEPYMFSANGVNISREGPIENMPDGNCIYKVTFNQLY